MEGPLHPLRPDLKSLNWREEKNQRQENRENAYSSPTGQKGICDGQALVRLQPW